MLLENQLKNSLDQLNQMNRDEDTVTYDALMAKINQQK